MKERKLMKIQLNGEELGELILTLEYCPECFTQLKENPEQSHLYPPDRFDELEIITNYIRTIVKDVTLTVRIGNNWVDFTSKK